MNVGVHKTDEVDAGTGHVHLVDLSASELEFKTFHVGTGHKVEIFVTLGGVGTVGVRSGGTGRESEGFVKRIQFAIGQLIATVGQFKGAILRQQIGVVGLYASCGGGLNGHPSGELNAHATAHMAHLEIDILWVGCGGYGIIGSG